VWIGPFGPPKELPREGAPSPGVFCGGKGHTTPFPNGGRSSHWSLVV
jgi:hypothetical protein